MAPGPIRSSDGASSSSGGPAFSGMPRSAGARDRLAAGLVIVLVAGFLVVAIVKPWAGSTAPMPAPGPSTARLASGAPSLRSVPTNGPTQSSPATPGPLPVAFTTPTPPPVSAAWTGLRWRRVSPDDPLRLVTSVLAWRGGFIALGSFGGLASTPIWTSADGREWIPLPVDTSTGFWPGLAILGVAGLPVDAGVAGLPTGLVALTSTAGPCGGLCAPGSPPQVMSWTSNDGRSWTPHTLPADWQASAAVAAPILAAGPAGSVVASRGPDARLAISSDGARWRSLPADTLPRRFGLDDLSGTATGYVAIGRWTSGDGDRPASLWSSDARHWSRIPTILPPSDTGVRPATTRLMAARDGVIGVGREPGRPRRALWWQSSDGRKWEELRTYGPLGATTCVGEGCGPGPAGTVLGDGYRFVALRGGSKAGAWESADGRAWRRLAMAGDVPDGYANAAVLLPGGIVVTDGSTTWFGEAFVG
jgi:hypothetical protein